MSSGIIVQLKNTVLLAKLKVSLCDESIFRKFPVNVVYIRDERMRCYVSKDILIESKWFIVIEIIICDENFF